MTQSHSSLAVCSPGNKSLLVHPVGGNLTQLMLQDVSKCSKNALNLRPIFTMKLTNGGQILDVLSLGTSNWGLECNIAACTRNELYHVRTVSVSDYQAPEEFNTKLNKQRKGIPFENVILEPMQRWTLSSNIVCSAASPLNSSSSPYMICLTSNGRVQLWNPSRGFFTTCCVQINNDILQSNIDANSFSDLNNVTMDCSHDPMKCYISYKHRFHTIDLRCRVVSPSLYSTPFMISSLKQSLEDPNHVYVCYRGSIIIMDLRHTRTFFIHRHIADAHSLTHLSPSSSFIDTTSNKRLFGGMWSCSMFSITNCYKILINLEIFVGSSTYSPQLFVHTIQNSMLFHRNNNSYCDSSEELLFGS
jgi:hypothetical protein